MRSVPVAAKYDGLVKMLPMWQNFKTNKNITDVKIQTILHPFHLPI